MIYVISNEEMNAKKMEKNVLFYVTCYDLAVQFSILCFVDGNLLALISVDAFQFDFPNKVVEADISVELLTFNCCCSTSHN